jgi:hypothetical protein
MKKMDQAFKTIMPNGLFSYADSLGPAIWFYLWCVARTTKEVSYGDDEQDDKRYGRVLGGMPVRNQDLREDFPEFSDWTLNEWRKKCTEAKLIRTKRTPVGIVIEVIDSVKFPKEPPDWKESWKGDVGGTLHQSEAKETDVGKSPISVILV